MDHSGRQFWQDYHYQPTISIPRKQPLDYLTPQIIHVLALKIIKIVDGFCFIEESSVFYCRCMNKSSLILMIYWVLQTYTKISQKMSEYYPCQSCWINAGNCNGCALLVGCFGSWCCKGQLMQLHDPNCCYCFQLSGLGCNLLCCGIVCCHPPWFNTYSQQQFGMPNQPSPYVHNQQRHNNNQGPYQNPTPYSRPNNPNLPINPIVNPIVNPISPYNNNNNNQVYENNPYNRVHANPSQVETPTTFQKDPYSHL